MIERVALLDSDTLSEISRGHRTVLARARRYLERHGRLTVSAVSVFERLRGYHLALRRGRPFEPQLRQFEAFQAACIVLPLDAPAASRAARIWAALPGRARQNLGDILIAAIASSRGLPLVTRNRRDFDPIASLDFTTLELLDWSR